MVVENLDLDQFGYREAGKIIPGTIPLGEVVIRNPLNVVPSLKTEVINELGKKYHFFAKSYTMDEMKNINYF